MEDILLTAQEVAKFLKVSESQIYSLMRRSEFPTVRIGRSVRVWKSDLLAYLDACRIIPPGGHEWSIGGEATTKARTTS
jgi:excisionase family DNA binding protein